MLPLNPMKHLKSCCSKLSIWWYSLVVKYFFGNTDQGQGGVCVRHAFATAVEQYLFNQRIDIDRNTNVGLALNEFKGTAGAVPRVFDGWNKQFMDKNSKLYFEFTSHIEEVEDGKYFTLFI